ncbi:dihydrofolate reductase family protein [Nonomuraea rubra]|uniref:dihydrofolate reductase family protein n=1 Tax=Nonomuraea rubra TaxID=46180 RepID=UPI00340DA5EB
MSKVIALVHVSIDGVLQQTTWPGSFWCREHAELHHGLLFASRALLLSRSGLERVMNAQAGYPGDFAARMRQIPKYVVSQTPLEPGWNTIPLKDDLPGKVAGLRAEPGGSLLVYGDDELTGVLIRHGLVDELKLFIRPVLPGAGPRLLNEAVDHTEWQLTGVMTLHSGAVVLDYRPDPRAWRKESSWRTNSSTTAPSPNARRSSGQVAPGSPSMWASTWSTS